MSQSHRRSAQEFQSFQNFPDRFAFVKCRCGWDAQTANKHIICHCNLRQPAASSYDSITPQTTRVRRGRYHKWYPEIGHSDPRLESNWSMRVDRCRWRSSSMFYGPRKACGCLSPCAVFPCTWIICSLTRADLKSVGP